MWNSTLNLQKSLCIECERWKFRNHFNTGHERSTLTLKLKQKNTHFKWQMYIGFSIKIKEDEKKTIVNKIKRVTWKMKSRLLIIMNSYLCKFGICNQVPHYKGRHSIALSLPTYLRLLHSHLATFILEKYQYN